MIRKLINYILVSVVCLSCFSYKAAAQDTRVFVKLDQATIRIGDQTGLHLSVEQPVKEQVIFPKPGDTITGKIQVIRTGKNDTIPDKNDHNRITVTQNITITSFDAGAYIIPPFVFKTKTGELKTGESVLTVQSVKVDTTKAIYDIKQPLAVSYSFMDWLKDNWAWVLLPLLGIICIAVLIWYLRKRLKNKPVFAVVKPALPAHTIALNKLQELRDKKLWQQDQVKAYYSELSDVLREYLEKRYVIKTHEKTTDEIFTGLQQLDLSAEHRNMLYQLLSTADLVKFAKGKPSAIENEQCIENAVSFVRHTQLTERPADTQVRGNKEEPVNTQEQVNKEGSTDPKRSENKEGGSTGEHI